MKITRKLTLKYHATCFEICDDCAFPFFPVVLQQEAFFLFIKFNQYLNFLAISSVNFAIKMSISFFFPNCHI